MGIVFHARLQFVADFGHCALLRAKRKRSSIRAKQRIVHVGHDGESCSLRRGQQTGCIDARDLRQVAAFAFQLVSCRIQKLYAQRPGAAHAAVVRGAAADRDGELGAARVQRGSDQFAGAVGGSAAGVTLFGRHQNQPRSRCHLDDGRTPGEQAVARCDRFAQRSRNGRRHPLAAGRQNDRLRCALAAVRHGNGLAGAAGEDFFRCCGQQLAGAYGTEGPFKGIRCEYEFHFVSLLFVVEVFKSAAPGLTENEQESEYDRRT